MKNLDKLLEDTGNRELIIDYILYQFCIDKSNFKLLKLMACDKCDFYSPGKECDDTVSAWLHEEYTAGSKMDDKEFMTDLLIQIAKYARKNKYSVDETIKIISNNSLNLLEIATFENLGKEDGEE